MKYLKKNSKERKSLIGLTALMMLVFVILFSFGTYAYFFAENKSTGGDLQIGKVKLGRTNLVIPQDKVAMPGMEIIPANATIEYEGQPAYYRIITTLEFYENKQGTTYTGKIENGIIPNIDTIFSEIAGTGTINLTSAAITLPPEMDNVFKRTYLKVLLQVDVIQKANLPKEITTSRAAFAWKDGDMIKEKIKVPTEPITIPSGTTSKSVAVQTEIGTGENLGKFRLTAKDVVTTNKNANTLAQTNQEFYFFMNSTDISDASYKDYIFSKPTYYFNTWYNCPDLILNLRPVYLTPNCGTGSSAIQDLELHALTTENVVVSHNVKGIKVNVNDQASWTDTEPKNQLVKTIVLPNTITNIPCLGLINFSELTNVIIPEGVVDIKYAAFANNGKLENIKFPSTLRRLGNNAFSNCNKMTEVILPYGVEYIGAMSIAGMKLLEYVYLPDTVIQNDGVSQDVDKHGDWNYALALNPNLNNIVLSKNIKFFSREFLLSSSAKKNIFINAEKGWTPTGWNAGWLNGGKIYYSGEWTFDINGRPIAIA